MPDEAPIAARKLRFKAAVVDAALLAAGVALAGVTFHLMGGHFTLAPKALYGYVGTICSMLLFYHLLWSVLGRETAGMRCFHLRIVTFDGYEPEWPRRVMRLAAACLSIAALGLGLLWALVDEEGLTWHDHISKTFPALRGAEPGMFHRK